ncbi:hypothetical protein [Candidatus Mycoplasma haematohominis]|uniref:hypothetical protein n=1 Tax=Candidatus Mycoplasma haematohominis TaxID=1494318 RepID=UPI001C0A7503|nr:hypothetical protein [Candidatus Mycoplasma haemohominis]
MLSETKITIAVAAIGGNATLGVSIHEFLKACLLNNVVEDEAFLTLDNSNIKTIIPARKKTVTVVFDESKKANFDPRAHANASPSKIDSRYYKSHTLYEMRHIKEEHRSKLAASKSENKDWWETAYKSRKYMIKNQKFSSPSVKFIGGYKSGIIWNLEKDLYMNQFCYRIYGSPTKYEEYKDLFWLVCSVDGKDPTEGSSVEGKISSGKRASFSTEGNKSKSIIYMTLGQAKKKEEDLEKLKIQESERDKFVVYDWKKDWWEWSFEYRFQKDIKDETSAFPLSNKFKNIRNGWDEKIENDTSLNKVCKDFYESDNSSSDEVEDAWRYCSDTGSRI